MAAHFTGPVLHSAKGTNGLRGWFSNQAVLSDPDYVVKMVDYLKASDYSTTDTTLTLVGTGTAVVSTSAATNGLLTLTTTTGGTDSNNLQDNQLDWLLDNTASYNGKRMWFETNVSISSITDVDMFVGLASASTTALTAANAVGFRVTSGSGAIALQTTASSVSTSVASGQSMAAGTLLKLGFMFDGGNVIRFFINRSEIAQVATNIPVNTAMAVTAVVKANSAAARTMVIDYTTAVKER